mmetsp:Transcript_118468/g.379812  ORF Transcript_118468/g.379812 Transcript_118468/m.379812 type:complete len:92 (-) Transcript_118468:88-363(-)
MQVLKVPALNDSGLRLASFAQRVSTPSSWEFSLPMGVQGFSQGSFHGPSEFAMPVKVSTEIPTAHEDADEPMFTLMAVATSKAKTLASTTL